MPVAPVVPITPETLELGSEWRKAADLAAHNLGFSLALAELTPEHWQLVLASVTDRMRLLGASLPVGWRRALARQVGRSEGEGPAQGKVLALAAKRKEIATHVAGELGLGDIANLVLRIAPSSISRPQRRLKGAAAIPTRLPTAPTQIGPCAGC